MNKSQTAGGRTFRGGLKTWVKRGAKFLLGLIAIYILIVLVGLVPVNNDFEPTSPGGVEILVVSSAIHSDIIFPIKNEIMDWRSEFGPQDFNGDISRATHVAIGWGDRGFYLETPEWSDLKARTVFRALLWPSGTCMHVTVGNRPKDSGSVRSVMISDEQYATLVDYVRASFQRDEEKQVVPLPGFAYEAIGDKRHPPNGFFAAVGRYHCLNTCNSWTGRALKKAGLRVPWLTPLPNTLYLYWEGTDAPDTQLGSRCRRRYGNGQEETFPINAIRKTVGRHDRPPRDRLQRLCRSSSPRPAATATSPTRRLASRRFHPNRQSMRMILASQLGLFT